MPTFLNQHYAPAVAHTWEKTAAGFIRCRARVLKEGVMNYGREELSELPDGFDAPVVRVLVTRESMGTGESLRSLETAQATAWDHRWITPENAATASVGSVVGTPRIDGPYLECDMVITDPQAIADIEAGKLPEISSAYEAGIVFEQGEFDGQPYDAKQVGLTFNHNAIIPQGAGRAGTDVRILNKDQGRYEITGMEDGEEFKAYASTPETAKMVATGKNVQQARIFDTWEHKFINCKEVVMADEMKLVRVKLRNTGKYINVKEEDAPAVEEDQAKGEEVSVGSGKKLEELMAQVEDLNGQIAELTAQAEEGKGELSVYKEKLDELLSDEAAEQKAEGMNEERAEADDIIENVTADFPPEKKEEVKNALAPGGKRLYGEKMKRAVLNVSGVKCENMSPAEVNGAFRAQHAMIRNGFGKKVVAGAQVFRNTVDVKTKLQNDRAEISRLWGKKVA